MISSVKTKSLPDNRKETKPNEWREREREREDSNSELQVLQVEK